MARANNRPVNWKNEKAQFSEKSGQEVMIGPGARSLGGKVDVRAVENSRSNAKNTLTGLGRDFVP